MKESAAKAVRHKKDASICRAVDLVKNGSAHAVVSAGHTGAAVVACVLKLRTLKGIDRPAIACLLPTQNRVFVLIDGGANPDSNPENLVQFAIMGSVFSAHVLGYNNPSVALMSIGEENMQGNDVTKEAFKLLKASGLNFRGNIEGHDLFEKPAEVVVCDGFTGNVVLKTTEAVAHAILSWLKLELFKNPVRKLGAKLAEGAFKSIRKKTNYEEYGGMPLLGVNGVCIIAHGASSPVALKNAIRAATESIKQEINPKILRAVQSYSHLEHRDNLLGVEYRQKFFVSGDVAFTLGILELVFADVLPKLFGEFGPGEWVFADHCGQCGVGLHGFAKGVFGGGGFLRGRHQAIRTRRAWLPSEKSTVFSAVRGSATANLSR